MTNNKAHDARWYSFKNDEPFLLDASVWLYLFAAPSDPKSSFADGYSQVFKKMLVGKVSLILDALVLSEYLNRYIRIEYRAWTSKYPNLKDFRKSSDFGPVAQSAATQAKQILKLCSCCDHLFSKCDLTRVLTDFENGLMDLNDGMLIEACRLNGWKFLTNDSDCVLGGIHLLTIHPRLLKACP